MEHTIKTWRKDAGKRKPVAGSEHIERHWATELRSDYRYLRRLGVRRQTARSILHGAYHVGLNAARQEAHEKRLHEIRAGAA
jgi:hypothetical protein